MMENEMQLNISVPLLSMRKHLSPRVPAVGTVAIVTEKSPLGGHLALLEERSECESEQVRNPIAIPFKWEKAPGRPKGPCLYHFDKEPAITPFDVSTLRPPPGRLVDVNRVAGLADETHISGEKSMVQNNHKCQVEECLDADKESDNDSEDDAFFDALDTLSPNKLLSLKSGISGSSGNFSADLQTRDFMLSRFLPAAKAAVVHTPRHVPMKQPGVDARPYANQHLEYIEIEDEDGESDDPEIKTEKTCGFFRRLCAKNVTSHPWMKLKTQSPKPSSGKVKRLIKNVYSGRFDKVTYPSEVTYEELPKVFNKLRDEPKRISFSSNSHKASSIGNERPSSTFREGARFFGLPKPIEPKTDEIIPLIERDEAIIQVSAQRSKIPGVSLIKKKCDREGNFLGLEEHKGSENFVNGREEYNWTVLLPPIPPPSPKTPSDSWLRRTLPPIYSRNYFYHSNGGSHLQYVSTKFGKVVKSSKLHDHHHVRFSKVTQ